MGGVDLAVALDRPPHDLPGPLGVEPQDPVGPVEHQVDQGADGQPAGRGPAPGAAHAVGHHHAVGRLLRPGRHVAVRKVRLQQVEVAAYPDDQEVVLVGGAHLPHVRQAGDVNLDQGRERRGRLERRERGG
jgi:hypothetical protein